MLKKSLGYNLNICDNQIFLNSWHTRRSPSGKQNNIRIPANINTIRGALLNSLKWSSSRLTVILTP